MRKSILTLTAIASLMSSTFIIAGENYNYSYITLGGSFENYDIGNQTVDGSGGFIHGAYELPSIPVVLNGGYTYNKISEDELGSGVELDSNTYFVGANVVFSPTPNLDILPGVSIGRADGNLSLDSYELQEELTIYSASLDARFHVERGLWLNAGYTYQDFDDDLYESADIFKIGAEYMATNDWGFGLNYLANSDQNATQLYVKVFY